MFLILSSKLLGFLCFVNIILKCVYSNRVHFFLQTSGPPFAMAILQSMYWRLVFVISKKFKMLISNKGNINKLNFWSVFLMQLSIKCDLFFVKTSLTGNVCTSGAEGYRWRNRSESSGHPNHQFCSCKQVTNPGYSHLLRS